MLDGTLYILQRIIEDTIDEAELTYKNKYVNTENILITKIIANVGGDWEELPPLVLDLETETIYFQNSK